MPRPPPLPHLTAIRFARPACLALALLSGGAALAQSVPDAGRLLEQNRPPPAAPPLTVPDIRSEEAPPEETGGPRIPVAHLRIEGATRFSARELHALVADGEGRELSLGELRALARRITEHYRARGYLLARAYLPAQTVEAGEIVIAVAEGRLGTVSVDNAAGLRGAALAPLAALQGGEPAQSEALERALLLVSDLPGSAVHATLRPGSLPGTSDLAVTVAPGARVAGRLEADSHGDRYSGRYRVGATVQFNEPLRLGDQLTLRALGSDPGLAFGRVAWQLPVLPQGTRLGIAVSQMTYQLGKELAPLGASGEARTGSLLALHPILRQKALNLTLQAQYDQVRLQDRIARTATTVDKALERGSALLLGEARDGLLGGGVTQFSVGYTRGRLSLDADSASLDALSARTAGTFGKWQGSWQRLQSLTDATALFAAAQAQWASHNLDSSEKLWLGGPNAVRAYPQGEAPGDSGYVLNLEARHRLPVDSSATWQGTLFIDHGHVRINRHPWQAGENERRLSGAGLGLTVNAPGRWLVQANLAWRLGHAPSVSAPEHQPRVWLQALRAF